MEKVIGNIVQLWLFVIYGNVNRYGFVVDDWGNIFLGYEDLIFKVYYFDINMNIWKKFYVIVMNMVDI